VLSTVAHMPSAKLPIRAAASVACCAMPSAK
jgi:hypothetical protein